MRKETITVCSDGKQFRDPLAAEYYEAMIKPRMEAALEREQRLKRLARENNLIITYCYETDEVEFSF